MDCIFIMKNFKTIDSLIVYLLQRFGKLTCRYQVMSKTDKITK